MTITSLPHNSSLPQNHNESSCLTDLPMVAIENILSYLPLQAEWCACCLTSKKFKAVIKKIYPLGELVNAIKNRQFDEIKNLLNRGVTIHLRIKGTKFCPNVHYTPLICAQEYGLPNDIIELIKKRDQGFTEQFLKNKLLSLTFDIDPTYVINDCAFYGYGLDHLSHHHRLLLDILASLKSFFDNFDADTWDKNKTKRLLAALEMHPCISCSKEETANKVIQKIKNNELVIFSKSVNDHRHWVTYAGMGSLIAIGNRGLGCGNKCGAAVYNISKDFSYSDIDTLFDVNEKPQPVHATDSCLLDLEKQKTGSCSRFNLEAGILAGIFLLLSEIEESKRIFKQWLKYDHEMKIDTIIQKRTLDGYDLQTLANIYITFDACPKAEKLWCFLLNSIKQTAWKEKDIQIKENLLVLLCEKSFLKGNFEKAIEITRMTGSITEAENDIIKTVTFIISKSANSSLRDSVLFEIIKTLLKKGDFENARKVIDLLTYDYKKIYMHKLIAAEYILLGQLESSLTEVDKFLNDDVYAKVDIYSSIALEYALKDNEKKYFEFINKINAFDPYARDIGFCNISKNLWVKGKIDLSLRLVVMIHYHSNFYTQLDNYLQQKLDYKTEIIIMDAIIKRINDNWSNEDRDLSLEVNIAQTLINQGKLTQALSIIEVICLGSDCKSSNPNKVPKKKNLEKAIDLIRMSKDAKDAKLGLKAASLVARG